MAEWQDISTAPMDGIAPKRCADCDSDCWHVENKTACWLGGRRITPIGVLETDIADGFCPWLHDGVEMPEPSKEGE